MMINYVWKDSEKIDMDRTIFVSTANHAIPAWEKKKKQHPYPPLETQAPKKNIAAETFLGAGVPQENNHKTQMAWF